MIGASLGAIGFASGECDCIQGSGIARSSPGLGSNVAHIS